MHTGDEVEIVGILSHDEDHVQGVWKMFRKLLDEGRAGDNIGALLRGTKKEEVGAGSGAREVGFDHAAQRVSTAEVYVLTKDEGGRHTPFFNNYRPQFFFLTTDISGCGGSCRVVRRW